MSPAAINSLHDDMAKLRAEAEIQLKRIAQLQAQLDRALPELARLR
ncbi:MAG: hypothetical protein IT176_11935 [Acidobacteria bacterium]|nr:hypothetical protein [Acidobacteriota bacterium]